MTLQNAVIYPEQKTYGETKLNFKNFIRVSYIQCPGLTLQELLNWNEVLKMREN